MAHTMRKVTGQQEDEAQVEILNFVEQRARIESMFQKNLAKENEDVEMEEFITGMSEMNVNLSTEEIKTLFTYIKLCSGEQKDDDDEEEEEEEDTISLDDFTVFFLRQWNSSELRRLQNAVLKPFHEKKSSHLIKNADFVEMLDPFELEKETRDMHEHLNELVARESKIQSNRENIINQLKIYESKQHTINERRANEWNVWEVALKLQKEGLEEYAVLFVERKIDGTALLYDLTDELLITEIGVKKIHLRKIHRIVQELREKSRKKWDEEVFEMARFIPKNQERLIVQFEQMKQQKEQIQHDLQHKIYKLQKSLDLANGLIERAKKDGYLESEADERSDTGSTIGNLEVLPEIHGRTGETEMETPIAHQSSNEHDNGLSEWGSVIEVNDTKTEPDMKTGYSEHRRWASLAANSSPLTQIMTRHQHQHPQRQSLDWRGNSEGNGTRSRRSVLVRAKTRLSDANRMIVVGSKAWWKYLAQKAQQNERFAQEANAPEWTIEEVAFWLKRVDLEEYVPQFVQENVNGEMLLKDLDMNMITQHLKVKALHSKRLLRHIEKLRTNSGTANTPIEEVSFVPLPRKMFLFFFLTSLFICGCKECFQVIGYGFKFLIQQLMFTTYTRINVQV